MRRATGTSKRATCIARVTNIASSRARLAVSTGMQTSVRATSTHGARIPPQLIQRN
ncbi:hypothetical protein LYNGBM3L_75310 [Moorena producens 3L]|uniref:Uncharacterized protein n=1 Tax=Moorena producens 3L TaxID=489825 RepID=F4XRD2_9CYAN|nr:hypothetical protein LYNGBM3L_75310 [Moorena producens 3L]